jgi:hypothetical protein
VSVLGRRLCTYWSTTRGDADPIATEVIKHLVALGDANVDVKLEIAASLGICKPGVRRSHESE